MDKRKLAKIPREQSTQEMIDTAERISGLRHIVTAKLVEENKILLLNFYEVSKLKKGKTDAAFRTFLSEDDYITQDLSMSNVKWLTASYENMNELTIIDGHWDYKIDKYVRVPRVCMNSSQELNICNKFFEKYKRKDDTEQTNYPWELIYRFQSEVKQLKLEKRHRKETDPIDALMEPVQPVPEEFFDWVWDEAMSFSQYLYYKDIGKNHAECECSRCKGISIVNRNEVRLRNNEKGICPACGCNVTFKARGKLPSCIDDERWVVYIDRTENGFIWRYFYASRTFRRESLKKPKEYYSERCRVFYTFEGKKPVTDSYEYTTYKTTGKLRWCHDEGKVACMLCILFPNNLPDAWEHTPMKYSALEYLSRAMPSESMRYEDAIKLYLDFPKLEWICKMGLNNLAEHLLGKGYRNYDYIAKLNVKGTTIYDILKLDKLNVKVLQAIDGDMGELRLLQVAQTVGLRFKPEQLKEYYETFGCNTEFLKEANRKVSLHKLVKYIVKESERYPMGKRGGCWMYSYNRYYEREDPRIERKQNLATDWLEYLKWCKELKYNLDNPFIYMPNNFKMVHDRTAKEYQELQDKKAAAEKLRREREAARQLELMQKAMEEMFKKNEGSDAFSIKGNGLVLVVPKGAADIRAEGESLHHCVGGYVERVAKGETSIFFIRKAEHPDKSYFTMEWNKGKVVQCRGLHNCGMPPEVEAFTKVFAQKMLEAMNKAKEVTRSGKRKKQNLQSA